MTGTKVFHEPQFVGVKEASNATGLSQATLRRFFDQGHCRGFRTPAGQRMFSREDLNRFRNIDTKDDSQEPEVKINYIYTRVSTKGQQDDLERQVEFIKQELVKAGKVPNNYHIIRDIGSGINFKKKGFNILMDNALQRSIGEVVVSNRDRLSRFGYDLIESIITKSGGKLTILDNPQDKSSEQALAEDLLSIVHIYSCRNMGKRSHRIKKDSRSETAEESKSQENDEVNQD